MLDNMCFDRRDCCLPSPGWNLDKNSASCCDGMASASKSRSRMRLPSSMIKRPSNSTKFSGLSRLVINLAEDVSTRAKNSQNRINKFFIHYDCKNVCNWTSNVTYNILQVSSCRRLNQSQTLERLGFSRPTCTHRSRLKHVSLSLIHMFLGSSIYMM